MPVRSTLLAGPRVNAQPFAFELHHVDAGTRARRGTFHTPHGPVETPAFMPVGTQGVVKGVSLAMLRATGAQMVLANTYHLALRPGERVVEALGGLHAFCGWPGPMLTDSGGFQLFSLATNTRVKEKGATFRSHIDGQPFELTPERAVAIQEALGSDVAMVLDHVLPLPSSREALEDACERTVRWAQRAKDAARRSDQAQFGIVQGGLDFVLRERCAAQLIELDFPGYALGGLSVGESPADMVRVVEFTAALLPAHKPRYLMGVGTPSDLLAAIARGVDMFDCVMPTRNGRNATVFTDRGQVKIRNLKYQLEAAPLEEGCPCPACQHSLGYLRHLFQAREMLGPMLASIHNLTYYQRLLAAARQAIAEDRFAAFSAEKLAGWGLTGMARED